jgi:hypothetical protein
VHPFSDAGMLAKEMPNTRILEANSLLELRTRPERLTNEIATFLDEIWASRRKAAKPRKAGTQRKRAAGKQGRARS